MSIFTDYTFIIVALGSAALGGISGVIGSFAVLRRQSLLGDGVSHAALPGVAAAFLITGIKSTAVLLAGALFSGLLAAFLISLAVKKTKLKFDAALAVVMSSFFGLGTVLITCAQKLPDATQAGLGSFIFGQASAMLKSDVILIVTCCVILLLGVILLWKELKVFSFDRDFALLIGYSEKKLGLILSLMTVITVILGIQTVGVVLMSAMLIAPAAAARQWSDRLWLMVALAALFASIFVLVSLLIAPKRGIVSRIIKRKSLRLKITVQSGNKGGEK